MTTTTHSEFNQATEALQVAKAFSQQLHGKTVLITGVNLKGLGYTTAEAFASQTPGCLIIAGRTPAKLQECIDALKAKYPKVNYRTLKIDLSSQQGVRDAAADFLSWADVPALDILVNNAAVMNLPELTFNKDGIEMQFATNHIGHFLFTSLVMPKLLKASEKNPKGATRIVNVSSASPQVAAMRWSDMNYEKINKTLPAEEQPAYAIHRAFGAQDAENKSYLPLEGYNQSKVANVLFSIAANKRLYNKHGILSFAIHPGVIKTELSREATPETLQAIDAMFKKGMHALKTQGAGAATSLVAALDPKLGPGEEKNGKENWGTYLADCQISDKAIPLAESNDQSERLYKLSEELVKQTFVW